MLSSEFTVQMQKILEYLSLREDAAVQMAPLLTNLRDDLSRHLPLQNQSPFLDQLQTHDFGADQIQMKPHDGIIRDDEVLTPEERRSLEEVKETMVNQGAVKFLEKVQRENRLNTEKLKQFIAYFAPKLDISYQQAQLSSIASIYRWFDENWENLEPYLSQLIIVNCDSK